jgi:ATP synthase protein I
MEDESRGVGGPKQGPPRAPRRQPSTGNRTLSGAVFAGVGIQFAATILVFTFLGNWLDNKFHTSPWLLILCVFLGAGGGFYSMYRQLKASQHRNGTDQ